jgi:hypothetical protein
MKWFGVLAAAALLGVAGGAGPALATHSGPELRTYGKGQALFGLGTFLETFDFDARLGPHEATDLFGEPHGHMHLKAVGFPDPSTFSLDVTADVTCLTVVGNRATIGGRITRLKSSLIDNRRGLLFTVTDNTIAGNQIAPDQFSGTRVLDVPQVCPPPGADTPIIEGDIVVEEN